MNGNLAIQQNHPIRSLDQPPALLFEMIRCFVTLSGTLNLSHAVTQLGITRQTLRRHISNIETAMGAPLFIVEDRRYRLSPLGESVLPEAQEILMRGITWLRGQSQTRNGLQCLHAKVEQWDFRQEQQPLGNIWTDPHILLRETFRAWSMSGGEIENPLFSHVRPYVIVYRPSDIGWICVEFGGKSVYVNWFGEDYARSSIGRPIQKMPAGAEFSQLIYQAFDEVQAAQMARLDHVFTYMPKSGKDFAPVVYQRLLLSGFFPDRSQAVINLIVPVEDPQISGLEEADKLKLDPVIPTDFSEQDARFEMLIRQQ